MAFEERDNLSGDDWQAAADTIQAEKERRARNRKDLELIWKEIDRQLAMDPLPRSVSSGDKKDWYPDIELPLQFNTLEVIAADARRLTFPRNSDWFFVNSNMSDQFMARWEKNRAKRSIVPGAGISEKIDQETADTVVKAVLEHYHKLYNFRGQIDLFFGEEIKYGTAVARVRDVTLANFSHEFRGLQAKTIVGPAMIPCPIWNTYLDDRMSALAHEGTALMPSVIRCSYQNVVDLQIAAQRGGTERGWMMDKIEKLRETQTKDKAKGQVEIIEFEGDLIIEKTGKNLFLPNARWKVAVGGHGAYVVRFEANPYPFVSYVTGHYMRDDLTSPYGASPLMKGQPIAEVAALAVNDLAACGSLHVRPPVAYDRNDAELEAKGGPQIYPGAVWASDNPERLKAHIVGDPMALLNSYLALVKQYENVTGVNDPRRGAETKSHTTATAIDIESTRGMSRTDDFVMDQETGPLATILYMEYEIARRVLKSPTPIAVNLDGIEGWLNIGSEDLPDTAEFRVAGSVGVLEQKERYQNYLAASQYAIQLATAAQQLAQVGAAQPVSLDIEAMIMEGFKLAGVPNPGKFVTSAQGMAGAAPAGPQLPGVVAGVPPQLSPRLLAGQ